MTLVHDITRRKLVHLGVLFRSSAWAFGVHNWFLHAWLDRAVVWVFSEVVGLHHPPNIKV